MFVQNKYYTWYSKIIEKAQLLERKKLKPTDKNYVYLENHHIKPASLFPELSRDKDNLVLLTAKEHFVCHLLLCKFTESHSKYKMINALIRMAYSESDEQKRYKSRSYSIVRKLIAEKNSARMKGVPKSEEWKQKMSLKMKGRKMDQSFSEKRSEINKILWANGTYKGRIKSEEEKQKIRIARSKQIITEETKRKISEKNKGQKRSEEWKQKIKIARAKRGKLVWIKDPNSKKCAYVNENISDKMINLGWIYGKYQKDAVYLTEMLSETICAQSPGQKHKAKEV